MEALHLALWLATLATTTRAGRFGLSELQRKALDTTVMEFNQKSKLSYAYKALSVQSKEETVVPHGKAITLEFRIRPTTCKKDVQKPETCPYQRSGRSQACFACFRYQDGNPQAMEQFWECIQTREPTQVKKQNQQKKCDDIKNKMVHLPGSYSFLHSEGQSQETYAVEPE